jgi:hypothetical protein
MFGVVCVFWQVHSVTPSPVTRFTPVILLVLNLSVVAVKAASERAGALLHVLNTDQSEPKRLEALRALEKTGDIDAPQILRSICDISPAIRAESVRLGTRIAAADPELELRLIALANDLSSVVKVQMIKSLPYFPSARAAAAFQNLLAEALVSKDAKLRSLAEALRKSSQSAGPQ